MNIEENNQKDRRDFLKKSGIFLGLLAFFTSFIKPGKYLFKSDSDSAFNPRDPNNKT
ncbi:MAG: hypothetical protein VX359_00930 [Chloroflexota bacterium]|tara:strand:+ start:30 stop:200 length:171 start_codon:yes stop_codon:yes gene_type:complete